MPLTHRSFFTTSQLFYLPSRRKKILQLHHGTGLASWNEFVQYKAASSYRNCSKTESTDDSFLKLLLHSFSWHRLTTKKNPISCVLAAAITLQTSNLFPSNVRRSNENTVVTISHDPYSTRFCPVLKRHRHINARIKIVVVQQQRSVVHVVNPEAWNHSSIRDAQMKLRRMTQLWKSLRHLSEEVKSRHSGY